jgi:hypothetical protein
MTLDLWSTRVTPCHKSSADAKIPNYVQKLFLFEQHLTSKSCATFRQACNSEYPDKEVLNKTKVHRLVKSSWNVMAHGDAREGKWRGNWRMGWVASTLYTTSEHGVSSITTADARTSAASSRLNWRLRRFKWTLSVSPKDETWFLRVCHHISNTV